MKRLSRKRGVCIVEEFEKVKSILGIDFETAAPQRASACSVGLYLKDLDTQTALFSREILINPQCAFSYFNMQIHGITPAMVADAPTFDQVLPTISSLIDNDTVVVAHNASFDMSVLRKSCDSFGLPYPRFQYYCTYFLSRALVPGLVSYSLPNVAEALQLNDFKHHRALDDAQTCIGIFEKLMGTYEAVTLEQLSRRSGIRYGIMDYNDYWACHHTRDTEYCVELPSPDSPDSSCPTIPENISNTHVMRQENNPFYYRMVVFTGVLAGMPRVEAEEAVVKMGGIIGSGINKSTNYLISGYQDLAVLNGNTKSTIMLKAEKYVADGYDIQIVNEADFFRMLDPELY